MQTRNVATGDLLDQPPSEQPGLGARWLHYEHASRSLRWHRCLCVMSMRHAELRRTRVSFLKRAQPRRVHVLLSMSAQYVCTMSTPATATNGRWWDDQATADTICSTTIPPLDQDECEHGIRLAFTSNGNAPASSGFDTERNDDFVYICAHA